MPSSAPASWWLDNRCRSGGRARGQDGGRWSRPTVRHFGPGSAEDQPARAFAASCFGTGRQHRVVARWRRVNRTDLSSQCRRTLVDPTRTCAAQEGRRSGAVFCRCQQQNTDYRALDQLGDARPSRTWLRWDAFAKYQQPVSSYTWADRGSPPASASRSPRRPATSRRWTTIPGAGPVDNNRDGSTAPAASYHWNEAAGDDRQVVAPAGASTTARPPGTWR